MMVGYEGDDEPRKEWWETVNDDVLCPRPQSGHLTPADVEFLRQCGIGEG